MEPNNIAPIDQAIGKLDPTKRILALVCAVLFVYGWILTIVVFHTPSQANPETKQLKQDLDRQKAISDSALIVAAKHRAREDSFQHIVNRIDSNNIKIIRAYAPSKVSSLTAAQRHAFADSVIYVHTKHGH
jgi:hypothetical protein